MEMSQKLGWEHTFGIPRGLRFETYPNLNIRGFRFETYPNLDIFVKHVPRDHSIKVPFHTQTTNAGFQETCPGVGPHLVVGFYFH